MRYRTIYADPPWPEHGGGKIKRGADRHYPLMSVKQIIELGSPSLDADALCHKFNEDSHLWMWVTNNYLHAGLLVMQAWGYRYVSMATWYKGSAPPEEEFPEIDSIAMEASGLGQYLRGDTEHCLFCVRGRCEYRTLPNGKRAQGRTAIFWPRGEHSEKPPIMREMIERVSHGPYVELFARQAVAGWDRWGYDAPSGEGRLEGLDRPIAEAE